MKVKSGLVIVDVTSGRKKLQREIKKGKKFKFEIIGTCDNPWGNDDGISQEFEVLVDKIHVTEVKK